MKLFCWIFYEINFENIYYTIFVLLNFRLSYFYIKLNHIIHIQDAVALVSPPHVNNETVAPESAAVALVSQNHVEEGAAVALVSYNHEEKAAAVALVSPPGAVALVSPPASVGEDFPPDKEADLVGGSGGATPPPSRPSSTPLRHAIALHARKLLSLRYYTITYVRNMYLKLNYAIIRSNTCNLVSQIHFHHFYMLNINKNMSILQEN